MRRIAKPLILAAILAAIGWMTVRHAFVPFWANLRVATLEQQLRGGLADSSVMRRAKAAREVAEQAALVSARSPRSVNSRVLAAIANLSLSQPHKAREWYCEALRIDRRPEIYLGLAEAELQIGAPTNAIGHLTLAAMHRPSILDGFRDIEVRESAYNGSQSILPPDAIVIRNARLSRDRLPITRFSTLTPGWNILGSARARRSAAGPSGPAAWRITAKSGEGLYQRLNSTVPPVSVLVDAELVIARGRIGVLAGPTLDPTHALVPRTTGQGRIQALSEDCPVRYVGLVCLSASCEFEVRRIDALSDRRGSCDLTSLSLVDRRLPSYDPLDWINCSD